MDPPHFKTRRYLVMVILTQFLTIVRRGLYVENGPSCLCNHYESQILVDTSMDLLCSSFIRHNKCVFVL